MQIMAEAFADQFKSSGAVNYLELLFEHKEIGPLTVTMQRVEGLTPSQKLAAAEQREEHLKATVDVLSAKNAELQQRLQQPIKLPDLRKEVSGERYVWSDGLYNYRTDLVQMLKEQGHKVEE